MGHTIKLNPISGKQPVVYHALSYLPSRHISKKIRLANLGLEMLKFKLSVFLLGCLSHRALL